eukprot:CAMPEP_0198575396 /NCGR_PEP_ID=MMETSP1462-20131121/116097_1 /TAXON_ID=1333877 /ORGANISM="Brandtodinium nutriculum, Strain RCC3387" /LENGTH=283 /DNA_ID=CAMNT_0044306637 /DNA_START=62 /DNA_END=913 /DNA_ORIENTATION=-
MAENTLDPAHFCSAHHATLGNRYTDPGVYNYKPIGTIDREGGFALGGDMGMLEFRPPCLVKYHPDYAAMPFRGTVVISTYCVPTRPGWVRPLAVVLQDKDPDQEVTLAVRALSVFMGPVPVWLQHVLAPLVLHQDCGLLYGQHRTLHERGYRPRHEGSVPFEKLVFCPTTVDRGALTFRRWLREHAGGGVPWACEDELDAKGSVDIYDTWNAHTKNCQYCLDAYRNLEALKHLGGAVGAGALLAMPQGAERVEVVLASSAFVGIFHVFNSLFVRYETHHADTD